MSRVIALMTSAALVLGAGVRSSDAQTPAASGRLIVTVVDPSNAVIPGAKVTAAGQEDATRAAAVPPVDTSAQGIAVLDNLTPGRYTLQVEFPGFETVTVRDVRVRSGDTRRSVTLPIKKINEAVTVGQDKRSASLDPRGAAFSTVLTREQIEALPDDPDEMEAALKAMAPPGAQLRVDGFSGGKLPPKSQIRSIRLPRLDAFAAQNHGGLNGLLFIDVLTQPGSGPLGGSTDFTFRNAALNARNPFTPTKGDEGMQQYGLGLNGALVPGKASFSVNAQGARQHDTGNLLAALADGTTDAQAVPRPTDRTSLNARLDTMAFNKDHMLRFAFQRTTADSRNNGVGGFDLPSRAYATDVSDNLFRVTENGPLGRRFFTESRLQVHWSSTDFRSATDAPAVRVLDAFTSGGAQQSGGSHAVEFEAATDLDYVRGPHSYRTGLLLEGGRYHSNDWSNYLGTFTFASLADYLAGRPATFTERTGNPDVRFTNLQAGVYAQDDFRLLKSLMVSYGLRYEAQTLIPDQNNFSPRVTLTWSPFKSGRTTFRGGWGFFTDWLGTSPYKQTLLEDGLHERDINVVDPSYPNPEFSAGFTPPTDRYLLGPGLVLPEAQNMNVGVDEALTPSLRLSATYTHRRGMRQLRGRNLNTPVDGVRPDPSFANVVEVVSDAAARVHSLNLNAIFLKTSWHRTIFAVNYTWTKSESNATGPFFLPAVGDDLAAEWGPNAPRHRVGATLNTQVVPDLGLTLLFRGQSGTPYNVTTGLDNNGDGVFNDRPAGLPRNSALTAAQWDLGLRVSYAIGFGTRPPVQGGGGAAIVVRTIGGSNVPGGFGGGAANARYRVEFYVAAQNVTNHRNYLGYSGVMTSPFFGQPTNVLNPRKVEVGLRFGF